jgi:hypothetical protein
MKTPYLYALALLATFATPALAAGDCVLIDKGGYFAYERGCPSAAGKTGGGSAYIDTNGDGATDTFTADKNG